MAERKEQLKQILKDLRSQEDRDRLREKASQFLKDVDAKTLSLAEQELMEEGVLTQDDLRELCGIHLDILGDTLEQKRGQPDEGHPVRILMDEHGVILGALQELEEIVQRAQAAQGFSEIADRMGRLGEISRLLLETEPHHQREEEVLFPRLERLGVTGPPRIMRLEHEELRARKKGLAELLEQADRVAFPDFARILEETGGYLATALRDHIFKEDNILYPTALETLPPEEWRQVIEDFERIGYCVFTPHVHQRS